MTTLITAAKETKHEVATRESGAKWKKAVGEGRVVLGQEPILAPIVNIDNI